MASDLLPLTGWTVAVTATRRRDELSALLVRRGARVVEAPAIRLVPVQDDQELRAATSACIAAPPDVVVVTTGVGFRGWLEAADGWGLGEALRTHLADASVLTRGPKAKGAVRAAGLTESWSPESESVEEVLRHLLAAGVAGLRVAVQLHGEPLPEVTRALREAGANVVEVPVYRWLPAEDLDPLQRLVDQVATRQVHCVTFTSAPAATSLLDLAAQVHREDAVRAAFVEDVLAACVGPVTAAPLERRGIPTVQPERARLGALVRTVVDELPRRVRHIRAGVHELEVRGHAVLVDGVPVEVTPQEAAILVALAGAGGDVLSEADLLAAPWYDERADGTAVDRHVARLRAALGPAGAVLQTEAGRGYRLAAPVASPPGTS